MDNYNIDLPRNTISYESDIWKLTTFSIRFEFLIIKSVFKITYNSKNALNGQKWKFNVLVESRVSA